MQKHILAVIIASMFPRFSVVATGDGAAVIPIENLMDASLDDIADLPAFIAPPKGHYKLLVEKFEQKTINDKPAVSMNLTVQGTLELANKSEAAVKDGTKFNLLYMMDNEFGQGAFKAVAKALAKGLGLNSPRVVEILALTNISITAAVGQRPDKNDKEKIYSTIQNIEVATA